MRLAGTLIPFGQTLCATFGQAVLLLLLGAVVTVFGHTVVLIQRALCAVFSNRVQRLAQVLEAGCAKGAD